MELVQLECDCTCADRCRQGRVGSAAKCIINVEPTRLAHKEAEHKDSSGVTRKDHYGSGKQPWDTMVELGIAPGFAAGNILKYLRRSKEPAHSEESARWYYMRLKELAHEPPNDACALTAPAMLRIVERELNHAEHVRLAS